MLAAPGAPRNIDEFTSEQETQIATGPFQLIDEFPAEQDAAAPA